MQCHMYLATILIYYFAGSTLVKKIPVFHEEIMKVNTQNENELLDYNIISSTGGAYQS